MRGRVLRREWEQVQGDEWQRWPRTTKTTPSAEAAGLHGEAKWNHHRLESSVIREEGRRTYLPVPSISWLIFCSELVPQGFSHPSVLGCHLVPPGSCMAAIFYAPIKVARCFMGALGRTSAPAGLLSSTRRAKLLWLLCCNTWPSRWGGCVCGGWQR